MRKLNLVVLVSFFILIGVLGIVDLVREEQMGVPPKFMETIDASSLEPRNITMPQDGIFQIYELVSERFRQKAKANQFYAVVRQHKVPAYVSTHQLGKRQYFAVKVGPFLSKQEAKQFETKLTKQQLHFNIEQKTIT